MGLDESLLERLVPDERTLEVAAVGRVDPHGVAVSTGLQPAVSRLGLRDGLVVAPALQVQHNVEALEHLRCRRVVACHVGQLVAPDRQRVRLHGDHGGRLDVLGVQVRLDVLVLRRLQHCPHRGCEQAAAEATERQQAHQRGGNVTTRLHVLRTTRRVHHDEGRQLEPLHLTHVAQVLDNIQRQHAAHRASDERQPLVRSVGRVLVQELRDGKRRGCAIEVFRAVGHGHDVAVLLPGRADRLGRRVTICQDTRQVDDELRTQPVDRLASAGDLRVHRSRQLEPHRGHQTVDGSHERDDDKRHHDQGNHEHDDRTQGQTDPLQNSGHANHPFSGCRIV